MTTTPADELRTAADKLRKRADKTEGGLASALREGTRDLFGKTASDPAAMHSPVARALADWLESYAYHLEKNTHPRWQETVAQQPLAVARAINAA